MPGSKFNTSVSAGPDFNSIDSRQRSQKRSSQADFSKSLKSKKTNDPNVVQSGDTTIQLFRGTTEPAFFNICIEERHANHLEQKDIDGESRLEICYRIMKDQLRRAKKELLFIKSEKAT